MADGYGVTISTFEFFQLFPDELAAIKYGEGCRWGDNVTCRFGESSRTSRQRQH